MKSKKTTDEQTYPGAAIDDATTNHNVTTALEEQYTRELNNNPRNDTSELEGNS